MTLLTLPTVLLSIQILSGISSFPGKARMSVPSVGISMLYLAEIVYELQDPELVTYFILFRSKYFPGHFVPSTCN
jgi:hypothetical protein